MKYQIKRRFRFEAAHYLPKYDGACKNMHGHSYKLEVTLVASELLNDMVFDFKDFKHLIHSKVVDQYDHQLLNEHFEVPTAERMARYSSIPCPSSRRITFS